MFIQPISFGYTNSSKRIHTPEYSNNKYQLKNTNSLVLPFAYPNISFTQKLNYCDFLNTIHRTYKNKSLKNVILSTIQNKDNYIGSGFHADVYSIPNVENYLIRIERKDFTPQGLIENPILSESQNELAPNFGQYIAKNNHGLFITKKVFGESHSLPNWSEVIKKLESGTGDITHANAKLILNKLTKLSEFPQKSFDDLASNIQKLNKYTDCEIDIMNPNNLIVDEKTKAINIIDLWYHHSNNGSTEPFNGIDSMINLMLDPLTYNKVFEKLSFNDKEQLTKVSEKIIQKVLTASEKFGLERTKDNAKIIYKDVDKRTTYNFALPAYEKFLNTFSEYLL